MTQPVAARDWLAHVFVLSSFAVAQPLYGVLSQGAAFFVAHAFSPVQILLFALAVSLGIPLAIAGLVALTGRLGDRVLLAAQLACVGALAFLALAAASARREEPEALLLGFAAGGAVAAALLYAGSRRLREFLRFAWPAGLIFPAAFLLLSPLRPLVLAPFAGQGERPEAELDVRDAPVFLIVFDELSTALLLDETGAIDAAHFPHFARLAGRSTWFRNASANSISTELAVATLLTGRYPDRDRPPTAAGHPHNLLTLLAPDYEVLAFDHLVRLCPERLCDPLSPRSLDVAAAARDLSVVYGHVLLPGRLRERLPPLEGRWSGFAEKGAAAEEPAKADAAQRNGESPAAPAIPFAHDAKRQFESFLAAIDRDARGRLFFIHSLLPHVPYVFLPDGRSYTTSRDFDTLPGWALSDNLWTTDEELVARGLQRVLLQTQMVDGLVGRFLDRLEELGLFDDALIVITADHGVNFVPGIPRRGFSSDPVTWATGLAVPLFVKTPGQRQGRLSDRNVEAVDVTPTILDALGRVPEGLCDGSSALDEAREPAPTKSALPWRGPVRTMPADLTPELFRAAAAKQAVFGSAKGAADYYGLQPFAEAVRRPLADFEIGPPRPVVVRLLAPDRFGAPDRAGEFAPAAVEGVLAGELDALESPRLAIVLNGHVGAIAKLFVKNGETRFHAIVDPRLLDPAGDEIAVYSIAAGGDGAIRLHPLRREGAARAAARGSGAPTPGDDG